jgi:PAS domain S-box-containing protein
METRDGQTQPALESLGKSSSRANSHGPALPLSQHDSITLPRLKLAPPNSNPLRANVAEFAPAPSLETIARDRLLSLTIGLAFALVIVAFGHIVNPVGWNLRSPLSMLQDTPWSNIPAWMLAIGSAFFLLVLRLLLPRLPQRWSFPLGKFTCAILVLNGLGWFTLGITPEKTVPLAFIVIGAGFLLFTMRSLVVIIIIAVSGWLFIAREAGFTSGWFYFGGVLGAACIVSLLFQRLQLQTIKQMLRSGPDSKRPSSIYSKPEDQDEHFRRWYEATFEGIAIHERGVILETNQALATLLHCEIITLPGQNLLDWFTRASRNVIEESILLGNFRPFEAVALRPDKTELHVELYTKRINYKGREVMVTAFRDITERQRAAAALNAEQTRLQQQYRRQLALAKLAVSTGESTEVARVLDCIAETASTVLPLQGGACILVHENDHFAMAASHLRALPHGFEAVHQLARVSEWIRENRETFVASDITREDPFAVNQPVEFISAYVGLPLLDGDKLLGILFALETEDPRQFKADEMDFLNELANRATVAIAKSQLYGQLSEANRVLQKQSALLLVQNEQLAQAKGAAEMASDAKSEFLAKVSHELRTPMNGVIGMTDYLLTTELNADQRESADALRSSAERLMIQIDHILDFSRLEQGAFAPVSVEFDVRELARETIKQGEPMLNGKSVALTLSLSEELPSRVRGDRSALRRALWNLVDNAIRFTKEGEVSVKVECESCDSGRDVIIFSVRDTGRGISPEEQSRLFDPFAQIENSFARSHEGLGLGLSTTKRLVERMDGRITVESATDKGSLFKIYIPVEVIEAGKAATAIS